MSSVWKVCLTKLHDVNFNVKNQKKNIVVKLWMFFYQILFGINIEEGGVSKEAVNLYKTLHGLLEINFVKNVHKLVFQNIKLSGI